MQAHGEPRSTNARRKYKYCQQLEDTSQYREVSLKDLLDVKQKIDTLKAINREKAAKCLGVSVRTIYRWLSNETLERVPHGGEFWVSVRSVYALYRKRYGSTADFNLFEESTP